MARVWLRTSPTDEVLGFCLGRHQRNAQLHVHAALEIRDGLDRCPFDRPGRDRKKLRAVAELLATFPQVPLLIDAKEQPINRPAGFEAQKPYDSGQQKTHTRKTQVVVAPCGRIEAVSDSVPGGAHHDRTRLRASGVLDQWAAGAGAMLDKRSGAVKTSHPEVPIGIPFQASRSPPRTEPQQAFNRIGARHRIGVAHTLAPLNRFTVVRPVFRGRRRERHSGVVRVVAQVGNRRLSITPLKTSAA